MTSVTVDLEDLKALVMSTGVIRSIDAAITMAKRDPFAKPLLSETHERLATAMRHAERSAANGSTVIGWDEPLTPEESKFLQRLQPLPGRSVEPFRFTLGDRMSGRVPADSLACKGMVVIGQLVNGILWAGSATPEWKLDPYQLAVKITARGVAKLADHDGRQEDLDLGPPWEK